MAKTVAAIFLAALLQNGCYGLADYGEEQRVSVLEDYYVDVDPENSFSLRTTLHDTIRDHQRFSYNATWDILEEADQDPSDPSRIIDVYRNQSYGILPVNRPYNREHTWPKSYGFPKSNSSNIPFTDCHSLFLSYSSYNGSRSNKPYDECDDECSDRPTIDGFANRTKSGVWETWSGRRGDVARAVLYMDLRYEGDSGAEPDLVLTDDMSLVKTTGGINAPLGYMGRLSVILRWHEEDPVDERERHRNEVVFAAQGNRNPFIDHPEWATCIFQGACDEEPTDPTDPPQTQHQIRMVEFHYDNAGQDVGEFVGLAGPSGADLSGWAIVGYSGNGGVPFRTVSLDGTIPTSGEVAIPFPGLQNGAPDGLALVSPDGIVTETIGYEGSFVGSQGPAAGVSFVDIGVKETSSTPVGYSLQKTESGWEGPLPARLLLTDL